MFSIFFCISDDHDWRLVLLAGLICVAASVTAVFLLRQAVASAGRSRRRWLATAGIATGFGIWATHFIAMLGYDPGVVIGYDAWLTGASLLVAAAMTTAGFAFACGIRRVSAPWAGGALVGGGIAAMHYLGISAVEMPASLRWSAGHVAASVVFALALTMPAVWLAARRRSARSGAAAAMLLVLGILLLHFTGMAGLRLVPTAAIGTDAAQLSPMALGIVICVAATVVLALCAGAAFLEGRARAAIRASEREFRILVQGITDCAIYMLDEDGRVASWNAGAERLKGYSADEIVGCPLDAFYTGEDRAAGYPRRALEIARAGGKFTGEGWRLRKDGSRFWAHVSIERVRDEHGAFRGFAKITRDMTRFKEDQDRLAAMTSNLDLALSNMHQGLCLFDADERLVVSNARFCELYGIDTDDVPAGTRFYDLLRGALVLRSGGDVSETLVREVYERHRACIRQPGGGTITVDFTPDLTMAIVHSPAKGGGWVSTFEDVTDRKRAEARINHMALHDSLTGLPNRAFFNERLDAELQSAGRGEGRVAAIAIDLDRFKDVNDSRGHAVGDALLKLLAARLGERLDEGEFVARLGGDEFAACKRYAESAELSDFLLRLEAALFAPAEVDGTEIKPAASLGVAVFPGDGVRREQLLNNADLAMYRAKAASAQSICYYEPNMDELARGRRLLAKDLRDAVRFDQLSLAYQVQCSVADGSIIGYEALARWTHPVRGVLSPAEFIPIAEECGAIHELGAWVLRRACADAAAWLQPYKVAVNLSPLQLAQADLAELVAAVMLETGLPPRRLELEITESAIIGDKQRALHTLRRIKAMGVTIAIDDFGTGYSSLDTLNSFPFDKIKIDRSFLSEAERSGQARAIIRAVLALGRSLGMPVLAEGVETEAQLELLRLEGCDEAQGYLFGRPVALAPPDARRAA